MSEQDIAAWREQYPSPADGWPPTPLQTALLSEAAVAGSPFDPGQFQTVVRLAGQIAPARMRAAAQALLERHPQLRTAVVSGARGGGLQLVVDGVQLPWQELDFSTLTIGERGPALDRFLSEDRLSRFDPAAPPLLRMALVRLGRERCELVVSAHRVLLDAASVRLLVPDLLRLYEAGGDAGVLPRPRSYPHYVRWLRGQDRDVAAEAWASELDGAGRPTLLAPAAAPAAVSADTAGVGRAEVRLPAKDAGRLSLCAIERGVTVNTLVQGAWAILLGAMTGRRDVLFATTVSGRPAALEGADSMVGPFAHTVPVRVRYAPGETAAGLLTRLHGRQTALVEHHHALATTGPLTAVSGLYDTAVDFASSLSPSPFARAARPLTAAGITVTGIRSYGGSRHPLTVVVDTGPGPGLVLEYHRTVFDEATACDIAARLAHVLEQLAADPEAQLGSIDVLTPAERTGLPELLENLADAGLAGAGAAG